MKPFLIPLHFTFMITGAVLMLVAAFLAALKKEGWFAMHKTLGTIGAISALAAFACIYLLKFKMHYPHFSSLHGLGGLTAVILVIVILISGYLVLKGIKPARPVHIWLGRLTALLLLGATFSGIIRIVEIMVG